MGTIVRKFGNSAGVSDCARHGLIEIRLTTTLNGLKKKIYCTTSKGADWVFERRAKSGAA